MATIIGLLATFGIYHGAKGQLVQDRELEQLSPTDQRHGQSDIKYRESGLRLRAAIDELIKTLPVEPKVEVPVPMGPGQRPRDVRIDATVEKYIPLGISFDAAESILYWGGFSITVWRGRNPSTSQLNPYAPRTSVWSFPTTAELDLRTVTPAVHVHLTAALFPKAPADFSAVGTIVAVVLKEKQ